MGNLDKNNPIPMYKQLEDIIKGNIASGKWGPDFKVPSEADFAKMYGISRITIRSACNHLVNEGVLYRVSGKGTYVSNTKIKTKSLAYMGFREQLEEMGYETKTKIIEKRKIKADFHLSKVLSVSEGSNILFIKRLRFLKGEAISLHYSYVPYKRCEGLEKYDLEKNQLCDILESEYSVKQTKVIETLQALGVNSEDAKLLDVEEGFPILLIEDVMYEQNEVAYEYSKVYFRADRVKLEFVYGK